MTYEDFINIYPWVDLVLQLFQGIFPTVVALLAIYINNKRAAERDRKNRKDKMAIDTLYNARVKYMQLTEQYNAMANIIRDLIKERDLQSRNELRQKYLDNMYKTQNLVSECESYNSLLRTMKVGVTAENALVNNFGEFIDGMGSIYEKYANTYNLEHDQYYFSIEESSNEVKEILSDTVAWEYVSIGNIDKKINEIL